MTCSSKPFYRRSASGFVLVAVLWSVAILGIVIAYLATLIDEKITASIDHQDSFYSEISAYATKETVLYLLASRERTYKGLDLDRKLSSAKGRQIFSGESYRRFGSPIDFDNTPYVGIDLCRFSIQDSASLLSLRSKDLSALEEALTHLGKTKAEVQRLKNSLRDYVDRDEEMIFAGAEKRSYPAQSRNLFPRNRYLSNPGELRNVLGWKSLLTEGELDLIINQSSIHVADRFNFNTMTDFRVASMFPDISVSQKLIEHKNKSFFSGARDLRRVAGLLDSNLLFQASYRPSNYTIITISCSDNNYGEKIGVTMTPKSSSKPWEIDYQLRLVSDLRDYQILEASYDKFNRENISQHDIFSN